MQDKKERVILHSDLNNYFASVETALNPDLKGKAVAVCGNAEERHGIVLAKSEEAKRFGIKTAMTVIEAKKLCPELITVPSHHDVYERYSQKVRKIYERFTDRIEPFGIDEAWLDVTDFSILGSGEHIANKIRECVKKELGLSCSVGVSFNKIFAKIGSDMKKPDATTVISKKDFVKKLWHLPVGDLLFVGRSTVERLEKYNVYTIGDLAGTDLDFLTEKFGKWGETLWIYANGLDQTPVKRADEEEDTKSVGNSVTTYRDLENLDDVKAVVSYLCESVSERVIKYGLGKAKTLSISIRDDQLVWFTRQCKLEYPTVLSEDYFNSAIKLFKENYEWRRFIRSIGVAVSDFTYGDESEQLFIGLDVEKYKKKVELEKRVSVLRSKYGVDSVRKAITLKDRQFSPPTHHADGGISGSHPKDGDEKP